MASATDARGGFEFARRQLHVALLLTLPRDFLHGAPLRVITAGVTGKDLSPPGADSRRLQPKPRCVIAFSFSTLPREAHVGRRGEAPGVDSGAICCPGKWRPPSRWFWSGTCPFLPGGSRCVHSRRPLGWGLGPGSLPQVRTSIGPYSLRGPVGPSASGALAPGSVTTDPRKPLQGASAWQRVPPGRHARRKERPSKPHLDRAPHTSLSLSPPPSVTLRGERHPLRAGKGRSVGIEAQRGCRALALTGGPFQVRGAREASCGGHAKT